MDEEEDDDDEEEEKGKKGVSRLYASYSPLGVFSVRTVSYGPSFLPFDLWPKREARGS